MIGLSKEATVLLRLSRMHMRAFQSKDEELRLRLFGFMNEFEFFFPEAEKELKEMYP